MNNKKVESYDLLFLDGEAETSSSLITNNGAYE